MPILTSNSRIKTFEKCMRLGWWEYEAPSGPDGSRGFEPTKLNLPLSTGGWCHQVAQGLFVLERAKTTDGVLRRSDFPWLADGQMGPTSALEVILGAKAGYQAEVSQRGIELGLSLDGAIPEERFLERTIQEQAAMIEAFGWAFNRVRLPRLLEEYDLLDVEREEQTPLSGDVLLQSRCDAVLRRKSDQRVFVYNLKTAKDPFRKSWQDQWLYDQQMMTEVLAVERRLGERVYGVIVDGFDKGERVTCWWHNLKELREGFSKPPAEGDEKWQRQRSRLLYGYMNDTIPSNTLYDWDGTGKGNAKGWRVFAAYEHDFSAGAASVHLVPPTGTTAIEYWVNWLPIEVVESCFATLPPVMRLDEHVDAKVRQIVSTERRLRAYRENLEQDDDRGPAERQEALDALFPQSSGYQCQYCAFKRVCFEGTDPSTSPDLYQPRVANHPTDVED